MSQKHLSGLLVSLSFIAACSSQKDLSEIDFTKVSVPQKAVEIGLPKLLWEAIDNDSKDYVDDAASIAQTIDYIPVTTFLWEKTKGVLGGVNWQLATGAGGGVIDLKHFVDSSRKGTFYISLKTLEMHEKGLRVYYLSQAKRRVLQGVPFGAGCGKAMEITSFAADNWSEKGLAVNTTAHRYVSVLAGIYFFMRPQEDRVSVSYVALMDSRYPELQCPNSGVGD